MLDIKQKHQFFHIWGNRTQLKAFFDYIDKQANTTRTNNVILTMGGDFTYMDADLYFTNLDRLIR